MPTLTNDTVERLTLFEQLDAMMIGWLERNAGVGRPVRPGEHAKAVLTIADSAMPEVERFCEEWAMTVERPARGIRPGRYTMRLVNGRHRRALPVTVR